MKQGSSLTTINNTTTAAAVCGPCGVEEQNFRHHVRLRGNFRRRCTTCVLRLHPQYFCTACLAVFDRSPPSDAVVYYSSSHPNCVSLTAGDLSSTSSRSMSKAEVAAAISGREEIEGGVDHVVYLMEKEKIDCRKDHVVAMPLSVVDPKIDCRIVDALNEGLVAASRKNGV